MRCNLQGSQCILTVPLLLKFSPLEYFPQTQRFQPAPYLVCFQTPAVTINMLCSQNPYSVPYVNDHQRKRSPKHKDHLHEFLSSPRSQINHSLLSCCLTNAFQQLSFFLNFFCNSFWLSSIGQWSKLPFTITRSQIYQFSNCNATSTSAIIS